MPAATHPAPLVDTAWVAAHLDDPAVRLIEVDLDPEEADPAGHVPVPRLDGISLARHLAETGSSIPIIPMSRPVTVVAEVYGDVVRKPFALDDLLARIASVLDERDAAAVGTPR